MALMIALPIGIFAAPGDPGAREVDTWQELWTAVSDPTVSEIYITGDFNRTTAANNQTSGQRLPTISRTLLIEGNGHTIGFGANQQSFVFANPAGGAAAAVTINNLKVTRTGAAHDTDTPYAFFYAASGVNNITLNLRGVQLVDTPRVRMIFFEGLAVANVGGYYDGANWIPTTWNSSAIYSVIDARRIEFAEGPVVFSSPRVTVYNPGGASSYIKVLPGADARVTNTATISTTLTSNQWLQALLYDGIVAGAYMEVDGGSLALTGNAAIRGPYGAVLNFVGDGFQFNIKNGGKVSATSNGASPAFVSEVSNSTYTVSGQGSLLYATSDDALVSYGATMRFRNISGQNLIIENGGEVRVIKTAGTGVGGQAPALRFGDGGNQSCIVRTGGKLFVESYGTGTPMAPGEVGEGNGGYNDALEYAADNFTFNVSGAGSIAQITAHNGAAINAGANADGTINVSDGATFIAEANSVSSSTNGEGATFRALGNSVNVTVSNPLYYDFRNNSGGKIFDTGTASTFTSVNTDLAVWPRTGAPAVFEGNPSASWTSISYSLTGADFATLVSDDPDGNFTSSTYDGMTTYGRMSGNNAAPKIAALPATNADTYVRATATIPEAQRYTAQGVVPNPDRGAWDNEVYATIQVTHLDGTVDYVTGVSLESEDVYGTTYDGVVRYDNLGQYLIPGEVYTIVDAWRGGSDPTSPRVHHSDPADITGGPITVEDVTPPNPVKIEIPEATKFWQETTVLSGTYDNMAVEGDPYNTEPVENIYVYLNGIELTSATVTLDAAGPGTWEAVLPANTLTAGDVVAIVAADSNGKRNPLADTVYHDATFLAAPALEVLEFPLELSAKNKSIGLVAAQEIKDAGNQQAIYDALEALIEAKATENPNLVNPYGNTNVSVVDDGGFSQEVFEQSAWIAAHGDVPVSFTIKYQFDSEPSFNSTAIVTVYPRDYGNGVAANDFRISTNNTSTLLAKTAADIEIELIQRAEAIAWEFYDDAADEYSGTFSPANVVLVSHDITTTPGFYDVTFAMKNAPSKTITVTAEVWQGNTPVLEVETPVVFWVGDPTAANRPAGSILVWTGDPAAIPAGYILPGDVDYLAGVTALDHVTGSNIIDKVTYAPAPDAVDFTKVGFYSYKYDVTNSDGNDATAYRLYVVADETITVVGKYIIEGHSFVVKEGADADPANIAAEADAWGWKADSSQPAGKVSVSLSVQSAGSYGPTATPGTYDVVFIINETIGEPVEVTHGVEGVITDLEELGKGVTASGTHYAVGANNVSLYPSELAGQAFTGLGADAQAFLKDKAEAQGWKLLNVASSANVVVTKNEIPANFAQGTPYEVTFAIEGAENIEVTVTFSIDNEAPVITFLEAPLVLDQTAASHLLTLDELRSEMLVEDSKDGDLKGVTEVWVNGQLQAPGTFSLNTQNVGVYRVKYYVVDSNGADAEAYRAIVVTDGRYIIDKNEGVIIGARNFLIKQVAVTGLEDQVLSYSEAEAYTIDGVDITTTLSALPLPAGYVAYDQLSGDPAVGEYNFTWKASGYTTEKTIIGKVVDATDVYNGSKNSPYGIVASDFTRNPVDAAAIDTDAELIAAAQAKAYKLVGSSFEVSTVVPRVVSWGSPDVFNSAGLGSYPGIAFGVSVDTVPLAAPPTIVHITGNVETGAAPVITLSTPYGVNKGAIFDPTTEVSAIDAEDNDLTSEIKYNAWSYAGFVDGDVNPVDTQVVGLYPMKYWVTDSDYNRDVAGRLVVVNDGTYELGVGRVLYGRSFVTKVGDVTTNPSGIEAEIKSKSKATVFDGTEDNPGADIGSNGVTVEPNTDGYGPSVGTYYPTLTTPGTDQQPINKVVGAKVVDADVIGPANPPATGPVTYVYGKNKNLRVSEAQAIVNDAAGLEAALLSTLEAAAVIAAPNGTFTNTGVKITAVAGPNGATAFSADKGPYTVTVSDVNEVTSIDLTVNVGEGDFPEVSAQPKPLEVAITSAAGTLTKAKILEGVTATDTEDGDFVAKDEVTITITDENGAVVTSIPSNVAAFYKVVYSVVDSDDNPASDSRALIVNDGRYVYDADYILSARSFIIGKFQVTPNAASAQIKQLSGAKAWTSSGDAADAAVSDVAGYTNSPGDYKPTIVVSGHPSVNKIITARVFNDDPGPGGGNGENGDRYAIEANNFRINYVDASALATKAGTAAYVAEFIQRSDAKSYDRTSSNLNRLGTIEIADDGGFAAGAPYYKAQGPKSVTVTLQVAEEPDTKVTITVYISSGAEPTLTVPEPRAVDLGANLGPIFYMTGVNAVDDPDGNITSKVEYDASAVDTSQVGIYKVKYWVEDSDYNYVEKYSLILVGITPIGDYAISAYSFVQIADEVETDSALVDDQIVSLSKAKAWRIKTTDPAEIDLLPIPVNNLLRVADRGGYTDVVADYDIEIGVTPEQGYSANGTVPIVGKVIDRDVIDDGPGPSGDSARYVVAADDAEIRLSEVGDFVGYTDAAKTRLINRADAVAYKLVTSVNGGLPPAAWDVDVTVNNITAGATLGDSFNVTFIAKGAPEAAVTVEFTVVDGNGPVFGPIAPLEIEWTEASQIVSDATLVTGVTATDVEDDAAGLPLAITVVGSPGIDSSVVGVYQVELKATDSDGNVANATRAVIVNDGRYVVEPGTSETVILGAKGYVIKAGDVESDPAAALAQAKALSFVEAYNEKGEDISSRIELVDGLTSSYLAHQVGVYNLTWKVAVPSAVQDALKTIKAEIIPDDYVIGPDPIAKDTQYVVIAKPFTVYASEAATLVAGGDDALIDKTDARLIKLVDNSLAVPDRDLRIVDNGGFVAQVGTYPIQIGAVGIDASKLSVIVGGTVLDDPVTPPPASNESPIITYVTPIVIPIAPAGTPDIGPAQIKAVGNVQATDAEDINLTSSVQVLAANGQAASFPADYPAVYQVTLTVTDSDNNTTTEKAAVVVDDGTFVYAPGYILRAHDFNIPARDVDISNPAEQIRIRGEVQAWKSDGTEIAASVISTAGYRNVAGAYVPVVGVYNDPLVGSTFISKTINVNVGPYSSVEVTFDANGGTLVGPRTIAVVEPATKLAYLPASPIRDNYTFRYWATSTAGTTQFTADTPVTSDITVYAIWTAVPSTPTPAPNVTINNPPAPAPNITINNPPAAGGTTYVTVTPATTPAAAPETTTITPTPTPEAPEATEEIPEEETPLAGPTKGWSLFDLIATILALALLVVFFIKFFYDRPRDEEYEEDPIDAQVWDSMTPDQRAQYQARREADYQAWIADQQKRSTRQKALFVNAPVLLIIAAALVEAIIVLFLTQNFAGPLTIVDNYSVIFALIVFVQLLTPMIAAIIRNSRQDKQGPLTPSQLTSGSGSATL